MLERAKELLASGEVKRVLGWEKGEFWYDLTPAFFETPESLENFVYSGFSGANLSKYLIGVKEQEGKTLVFLKPCDTLSFNQLIAEHRIDRQKVYVIGAGCKGMLDHDKMQAAGIRAEADVPAGEGRLKVMLDKCLTCGFAGGMQTEPPPFAHSGTPPFAAGSRGDPPAATRAPINRRPGKSSSLPHKTPRTMQQ